MTRHRDGRVRHANKMRSGTFLPAVDRHGRSELRAAVIIGKVVSICISDHDRPRHDRRRFDRSTRAGRRSSRLRLSGVCPLGRSWF